MFSAVRAVNYNKLIGRLVVAIHSMSRSGGGGRVDVGLSITKHYMGVGGGGGGARTNTVYLLLVSSKIMIKLHFY